MTVLVCVCYLLSFIAVVVFLQRTRTFDEKTISPTPCVYEIYTCYCNCVSPPSRVNVYDVHLSTDHTIPSLLYMSVDHIIHYYRRCFNHVLYWARSYINRVIISPLPWVRLQCLSDHRR